MEKVQIQELIGSLGLIYNAQFVPLSVSRNSDNDHLSLNWRVSIVSSRPKTPPLVTDYMQGIGHLPNYLQSLSYNAAYCDYLRKCCEEGTYFKRIKNKEIFFGYPKSSIPYNIPKPELIDVLYSLVSDANVLDYDSFEEWAGEFGYDSDSRKDEKIYNSCRETAIRLKKIIGAKALQDLAEAYQDY